MNHRLRAAFAALAFLFAAAAGHASELARADLSIVGLSLEVDTARVNTAADVPAYVQTIFGGKKNDQAVHIDGLSVLGDLTGPGLDAPITLFTAPGQQFVLPALHQTGEYTLQNIRLVDKDGKFLQQAAPSFATIEVSAVFNTSVTVKQLSPDELRARGITIDSRNYDVFQYSFTFTINNQDVIVPYTVVVDKRTHEAIQQPTPNPYPLPPVAPNTPPPPRFQPPSTYTLMLDDDPDAVDVINPPQFDIDKPIAEKPKIPAAIVIPTGFGVLHQFFAVILQVNNSAPQGSSIQLDNIRATLDAPLTLRLAKTTPSVSIGQAVPVYDASSGTTFLIAMAKGSAEWDLEALKTGTHTVNIDVRATYKNVGQPDVPLHGAVSASLVVSDPRFHITFSHPDTIRKGEPYTAYAFVSNLSAQSQTVELDTRDIPQCGQGYSSGVCRTEGTGITDLTLAPGEMSAVPYKLTPNIDGHIFAAAGDASDASSSVSVKLTMGVSASGIPLSPATLVMPYYARYLDPAFVDAQMGILGLGYSLATAPLTAASAKFPRVIKSDIFQRAQDITRAGQRLFVAPTDARDVLDNLALDLLDNVERPSLLTATTELAEWDQLRRQESDGRSASAALARQLEAAGLANGTSMKDFAAAFASATSHRSPFLFALVHGSSVSGAARPYALSLSGVTTKSTLDVPSEAASGWSRSLPYGELTRLASSSEAGELALVGRWKEDVQVSILPQSDHFSVDLIYPAAASGFLVTSFDVTGAHPGTPVTFTIAKGNSTIVVSGGSAVPLVNTLPLTPLMVIGAAQDLHLDAAGHLVSILFNRPVNPTDAANLRDLFTLTTRLDTKNYVSTRRNTAAVKYIPGAAVQDDATILNVSFDKSLTKNSLIAYALAFDPINGDAGGSAGAASLVPRIDNNASAGILFGHLLQADNTVVPQTAVELYSTNAQFDTTNDAGQFLFESVPKDIDNGINGNYLLSATANGKYTELHGSIRLLNTVEEVNLIFLGRGEAQGQLRYSDGTPIANQPVVVSSTIFGEFRSGTTGPDGRYDIKDVPVGPLTFIGRDQAGRFVYATNLIRAAGEVVSQDLVIQLQDPPGAGSVHVTVRRSDVSDPQASLVPNAHVGVYARGFGLKDGYTDANGSFDFTGVPAGVISILASEFNITPQSAAIEVDLKADTLFNAALTLNVPPPSDQASTVTVQGTVTKDSPAAPQDTTKDTIVPGAVLQIPGLASVVADAQGNFVYPNVPLSFGNGAKSMSVYDPATQRRGSFPLPTLTSGQANTFSPRLQSTKPGGYATMHVRLFGARGEAVSGYRVVTPYYPPITFQESTTPGVYELKNVAVPVTYDVYAVPTDRTGPYGDQWARGTISVAFDGQTGVADLHLQGQGTVIASFQINGQNCDLGACATGPVNVSYLAWDEVEQGLTGQTHRFDPDPQTGKVTIPKIPALSDVSVATIDNPAGYATTSTRLAFDGDSKNVTLHLTSLGDVTGRVFMPDVQNVVANAAVRLEGSVASYQPVPTKADGTFTFAGVAANQPFRITAEVTQDGIYRTGYVDARTPTGGGPVSNLTIVLREQSTVAGQIVDSTGAAVPLAKYWLHELTWPNRDFGTASNPLTADKNGRFIVNNVFTGGFRITAVSPAQQEIRGVYAGTIAYEADNSQSSIRVVVGSGGTGSITATVVDSQNNLAKVPNADVTLVRNGTDFDVASSDVNGVATFDQVPVDGSYSLRAFSKAIGTTGATPAFTVLQDQTSVQTITLQFRGSVSGFVRDPEGTPAEAPAVGAPVSLRELGFWTRASTDANGAFTFLGVPEGTFSVDAADPDSGRKTQTETNFISQGFPDRNGIILELARTAQLNVKAYLPDDAGNPGIIAPLVDVRVNQPSYEPFSYTRELQGNDLTFVKMDASKGYLVTVQEIGGEGRTVSMKGGFGGALTGNVSLTFPTSGSVNVTVLDGSSQPVGNAFVTIIGNGKTATLYTDATGKVTAGGFPLGSITVQATNHVVSASATGNLQSHSTPLSLTLNLGVTTSVTGRVLAEAGNGAPSAGTRVLLSATSRLLSNALLLETRTDANGKYEFDAIPVSGTTVTIRALGPDDVTVGATAIRQIPDGTTQPYPVDDLTLDATPPRVLSIDPANNANIVSPSSVITVVFSEPIGAQFLNTNYFQLVSTDDGQTVTNATVTGQGTVGAYTVTITAPDPTAAQIAAGQKYRLKSNVVYILAVRQGIQDLSGNSMAVTVGSSFTTVNYTEPAVIAITPTTDQPLPQQTTFRLKFNKPIDLAASAFSTVNGGVLTLEKLPSYKYSGSGTAITLGTPSIDPADSTALVVGLTAGATIDPASFYRLTINGTHDKQAPANVQSVPQVFDYVSYDNTTPAISINSPLPDGHNLIAGTTYTFTPTIVDEGTATPSTDIAFVDWFDQNGTAVLHAKTAPFSYTVSAPTNAPAFTLQATATDTSGHRSAIVSRSWTVDPNLPPKNVALTLTPNEGYPGQKVTEDASFDDEGLSATVNFQLKGTNADGSDYNAEAGGTRITRNTVADPWPHAVLSLSIPSTLKGSATVTATVIDDARQSTASAPAPLTVDTDTIPPVIVSFTPAAETHYQSGQTLSVQLKAKDAQTGIAKAVITIGTNTPVTINAVTSPSASYDQSSDTWTFTTSIVVPARNADTRTHVTAVAYDNAGLSTSTSADVVYDKVNDPSIPNAIWVTPVDEAVLPLGQAGLQTTLRVRSSGNVVSVTFSGPALAAPVTVTAPKSGTTDVFETRQLLTLPTDGTPTVLTATISDGVPAHQVDLPINVYATTVDTPVLSNILTITAANKDSFKGKTLLAQGSSTLITLEVPVSLGTLMVLDGAKVTTHQLNTLDLTITNRLFVDADSSIDESGKGYLGAWQTSDNNLNNHAARGMTYPDVTTGTGTIAGTGALSSAGSYGGLGAHGFTTPTDPVYGSITDPADFGSGGGGSPTCCTAAGANGGGALILRAPAATVALAGALRADGGHGYCGSPCIWGPASGGSIAVAANKLITGWSSRVTANGGDDDSFPNVSAGAGGGRVSVRVASRLDLDSTSRILQSRGGRNGFAQENNGSVDGGAGTVFLLRPAETNGELIVSSYDDRYPNSTHPVLGTPLGGTLTFDAITIGPRALARFDTTPALPANVTISSDPTALVLTPDKVPSLQINSVTPADGSSVAQGSSITVNYTATSQDDGIASVSMPFSANANTQTATAFDDTPTYPKSLTNQQKSVAIDPAAAAGASTLSVSVETRSGRIVTNVKNYNVVANAPPTILPLTVTPSGGVYPGQTVSVTAVASDDVAVTSLTLTSTLGTVTSGSPSTDPATHTTTTTFTIAVPLTATPNSVFTVTASATDGFQGHDPQKASADVKVLQDSVPPAISNTVVPASANEGSTVTVSATVIDNETGVNNVSATIDGTVSALTKGSGNTWSGTVRMPFIDGTSAIQKTITFKAADNAGVTSTLDVSINDNPVLDGTAPTLTWTCNTTGSIYRANDTAKLRVIAVPNTQSNPVSSVQFLIGSTVLPATASSTVTNGWEASYTVPASTDGTIISVRAVATSAGGSSSDLSTSFTVYNGPIITTATTLIATDTTYATQNLFIRNATVTMIGHHDFGRLIVLEGGKVIQQTSGTSKVDVSATDIFVACDGSIDVTGLGYGPGQTYTGATAPAGQGSGSHIGLANGGSNAGTTYGSVYRPQEAGGGGGSSNTGFGGGIIRISATTSLIDDGAIRANGTSVYNGSQSGNGAGGSVWITAGTLGGAGTIEANGSCCGTFSLTNGGGGAIAVEYQQLQAGASILTNTAAKGGTNSNNGTAGAGSVYLKNLSTSTYGDLIIDDKLATTATSQLQSLGTGTVTAVSGNNVTLSVTSVPPSFGGHWIEFSDAATSTLKGTWRADKVGADGKTVTLLPNSPTDTITVSVGDKFQGAYYFDSVQTKNGETLNSTDPIRLGVNGVANLQGPTTAGQYLQLQQVITGSSVTVNGNVSLLGVTADTLTVKNGATLTVPLNGTTPIPLAIAVKTLIVEAGGVIDVTGRGYASGKGYTGATVAAGQGSGSHIGLANGGSNAGTTYGSVYRPQEAGGSGGSSNTGFGGGIIRISATTSLIDDGAIRANGTSVYNGSQSGNGAGGSVWITAGTLGGAGTIEANGSCCGTFSLTNGGGGAIAVEYQQLQAGASILTNTAAKGGTNSNNGTAGAGSVYLKNLSTSTYGDLIIDDKLATTATSQLQSLGTGTVTAVSGNNVTLSVTSVPPSFGGHWIEFSDATTSALKGTWRADKVGADGKTVTLLLNSPTDTITVSVGDKFQGAYYFDSVQTKNGETLNSADPLRLGVGGVVNLQGPTAAGQYLQFNQVITGTTVTVNGNVSLLGIAAGTLTVKNGATLTVPSNGTTPNTLAITAGTLTIEAGGAIDVSGRGYGPGKTYTGATGAGGGGGGSHIGLASNSSAGTTFGSVYRPQEAGGGAGGSNTGFGGGVVRINATNGVTIDGAIRADGTNIYNGNVSANGAGGSVWITTTGTLGGAGLIEANGLCCGSGANSSSGGGAVAIEYQQLQAGALIVANTVAKGGNGGTGTGGAGSVYLKNLSTSTYGDLIIDDKLATTATSQLQSLGTGTVTAVSGNNVTLSVTSVPPSFGGHWIEFSDATTSALKGTWRADKVGADGKTVTLLLNSPTDTINVAVGDKFQGAYYFDSVQTKNGETLNSADPLRLGVGGVVNLQGPTAAGQYLQFNQVITGTTVTVNGNVSLLGITAGTLTVKNGATLTVPSNGTTPNTLAITAGTLTIESGGAIDVSGRGYGPGKTYTGATGAGGGGGGSHIGLASNSSAGTTFGSVYRPQEAGGGAGGNNTGFGGGVVRISATNGVTIDGAIRADGTNIYNGNVSANGAGGSVWITTGTLGGAGTIEANGLCCGSGANSSSGGGAVAIEYQQLQAGALILTNTAAKGGNGGTGTGGAGSVYLDNLSSATYGDLTIENYGAPVVNTTLPSLGNGTAASGTTGATLVTGKSSNIPPSFKGHWVEITSSTGTLKGTWRVDSVTPNSATVILASNAGETISLLPGDKWQGVYRFDNLRTKTGMKVTGGDPIRLGSAGADMTLDYTGLGTIDLTGDDIVGHNVSVTGSVTLNSITGNNVTLNGPITLNSINSTGAVTGNGTLTVPAITAGDLTYSGTLFVNTVNAATVHVGSGAKIAGLAGGGTAPLFLNLTTSLTVDANGTIDVTGRGYGVNTTYLNTQKPSNYDAGSHIGSGGGTNLPLAGTFGSVEQPQESGGGGDSSGGGATGGGVIRVIAPTVINNGSIKATGASLSIIQFTAGGAGGSVWITANTSFSGTGTIDASGGNGYSNGGGGGAITVEYGAGQWGGSNITAWGGTAANGWAGGSGTVLRKGPDTLFGELTVENFHRTTAKTTNLPSLGSGTAQAGTSGATLVTALSGAVPTYFAGHWVEIKDSTGILKGTWKIHTPQPANSATVTLDPNGSETISLVPGDKWQGVYRFDTVSSGTGGTITGADPIRLGVNGTLALNGPLSGQVDMSAYDVNTTTVTTDGGFAFSTITAATLTVNSKTLSAAKVTAPAVTVKSGAVLTNPAAAGAAGLFVDATGGTVTVESGGSIDVSGNGYAPHTTYSATTQLPGNYDAGSHIGTGGGTNAPLGATFGSVEQPQESGGGGDTSGGGGAGGGNVWIKAANVINNGSIKATGASPQIIQYTAAGAGGSVWIQATGAISGTGTIDASGGNGYSNGGGGGAVTVEYNSGTPWTITNWGGTAANGWAGGAGTVLTKGPGALYGDLRIDNNGKSTSTSKNTTLPALGGGTAQNGSSGATLVTSLASIPTYFKGHWVQVSNSSGPKGTWQITDVAGGTITLKPNGTETISIAVGDTWKGAYVFDHLIVRSANVQSSDALVGPTDLDSSSHLLEVPPAAPTASASSTPAEQAPAPAAGVTAPTGAIVDQVKVASVVLSDSSSTAIVTLTAPAPVGGALVTLSSSCSALALPANVTVPAGEMSVAFDVTAAKVEKPVDGIITATYRGIATAAVRIEPPH